MSPTNNENLPYPPFTKKGGGFENYSLNKISYGMPFFINGVVESKEN
jgi:hypothetical protein